MLNILFGFLLIVGGGLLASWLLGDTIALTFLQRIHDAYPSAFSGPIGDAYNFLTLILGDYLPLFILIAGVVWVIFESMYRRGNPQIVG